MRAAIFHQTVHLKETELRPIISSCPFCNQQAFKQIAITQKSPDVNWIQCGQCNFITTDRYPSQDALTYYYDHYYTSDQDTQVTFDNIEKFSNHLLQHYLRYRKDQKLPLDTIKIFDLGGGDGAISIALAKKLLDKGCCQNIQLVLCEPGNVVPPEKMNNIEFTWVKNINDYPSGDFDIIIASAVLEHIPDISQSFKSLLHKMKAGGMMYIRGPYMMPFKRIFRDMDMSFPGHVHDFSPEFFESVAGILKFKILKSTPSIVETSFYKHPIRSALSLACKTPWKFFKSWRFVGGWEVFLTKSADVSE